MERAMTREEAAELLRVFRRDDSGIPRIDAREFVRTYLDVTGTYSDQGWGRDFGHEPDRFSDWGRPVQKSRNKHR